MMVPYHSDVDLDVLLQLGSTNTFKRRVKKKSRELDRSLEFLLLHHNTPQFRVKTTSVAACAKCQEQEAVTVLNSMSLIILL